VPSPSLARAHTGSDQHQWSAARRSGIFPDFRADQQPLQPSGVDEAPNIPDYPVEAKSEYEGWVVLGWPHESSVAMARLVFSEMFDRLPKLRFVTHHCGATIPLLLGRVGPMWDGLGLRENDERNMAIRACMAQRSKRPIDYFRDFFHHRRRQ
jgi:hypothetical protein